MHTSDKLVSYTGGVNEVFNPPGAGHGIQRFVVPGEPGKTVGESRDLPERFERVAGRGGASILNAEHSYHGQVRVGRARQWVGFWPERPWL